MSEQFKPKNEIPKTPEELLLELREAERIENELETKKLYVRNADLFGVKKSKPNSGRSFPHSR